MSVGSFVLLVCWPFARPHFYQFRFRLQHTLNTQTHISISILSATRLFRTGSIVSSIVLFDVWHSVEVERFDVPNTFDVNLISESLTERTNFGQTKTIANLLLKLTTPCNIGFQHTALTAGVARAYAFFRHECIKLHYYYYWFCCCWCGPCFLVFAILAPVMRVCVCALFETRWRYL